VKDGLDAIQAAREEDGVPGAPVGPIDPRTAAFIVAIERVALVALDRGNWP